MDEDRWRPDPLTIAAARRQLADLSPGAAVKVDGNRITVGKDQFRLGRDRRWYRFTKRTGAWLLTAGPSDDPTDLGPGPGQDEPA
jgi:hypothetical protein